MKRILLAILFYTFIAGPILSQDVIEMKKEESGVYSIPCEVNGLKLRFIFDTGASAVSISLTEASFMLKNGYLDDSDITGTTNVQTADGKIAENYVINLNELKIGSVTLNNVRAIVSTGLDAPLLLGQSVLDNLGHWSVKESNLILNERESLKNPTFANIHDLKQYCEQLKSEGRGEEAIDAIVSYKNGEDFEGASLFLHTWEKGYPHQDYFDKCIDIFRNYSFETISQEYDALSELAWFYIYRLEDISNGTKLYEALARDNKYDKGYRWDAYNSLYIANFEENHSKAKSYAKEALENGMYQLAHWYSGDLIKEGKYSEAYQLLKKGDKENEWTCSYRLATGYIEGLWPVKNISEGLRILNKLIAEDSNSDAISYLCYYYLLKSDYDKVIHYASLSTLDYLRNIYQGIAYYHKKNYSFARQFLEDIDLHYGTNYIISSRLAILGEIYEKGLGVSLDFEKAFNYYNELCEYDPAWGYGMLGDMFFINELIKSDDERAYRYYILGANNDSGYCCFRLALMNHYGVGTYKNEVKAKEYKDKAIKLGFKATDFDF